MKTVSHCSIFVISLTFLILTGCLQRENDLSVTVFTAASTTDLLTELAVLFEEEKGIPVKLNPSSSGILAKQLNDGAHGDVFISANKKWTDYIETCGLVSESNEFLKNKLVLIAHIDSDQKPFLLDSVSDLPRRFSGKLSIADPAHVPAGEYGVRALSSLGWYEELEERFLPAPDVRGALTVVEFDEAELGIVYATDAQRSNKVKVISVFPPTSHPPVLYFCALLKESSTGGKEFYDFLMNNLNAEKIYVQHGFSRVGE